MDGGNLIVEPDVYDNVVVKDTIALKYCRKLLGAKEFLNNTRRYCLWLVDADAAELRKSHFIMYRLKACTEFREKSPKAATRKYAMTPTLFMEIRQPQMNYILVPRHSSENRRYIPMDFLSPKIISTDANSIIPNATLYHFGILMSNVHMAWVRVVCGRLEMRYRYSNDIVYNNFPWPAPTDAQKQTIEQTAKAILDARAKYPDASLADLYDETAMPPELRKAHQANDRAVMAAYHFDTKISEAECVARLMEMYRGLTDKEK
ncbi:MAG: hypothetical protein IJ741_10295 [Schwartzia sp.]|nr:hypothetical protein [Schwartzia sp. (in: firmicutes)]